MFGDEYLVKCRKTLIIKISIYIILLIYDGYIIIIDIKISVVKRCVVTIHNKLINFNN